MRRTTLLVLTVCPLFVACSSTSDVDNPEARPLDFSLASVDGQALPGLASSLPGLPLWEGSDASMLTVWRGEVVCHADGTAQGSFGFRLSAHGSEVWDPIVVELDLTCESTAPELVTFRDPATGEVLNGTLHEGSEGCPGLSMGIPSVRSLRAGYRPSLSKADLPAGLDFSGPMSGEFREKECSGR